MNQSKSNASKDLELVSAFVATFEYYLEIKASQPIRDENSLNLFGSEDVDSEIRIRISRLAAMRKFTFSKGDDLYLANVIKALLRLGLFEIDIESEKKLFEVLDDLHDGNVGPFTIHENEESDGTPDTLIVKEALYGLLLHGDLDKLKSHLSRNKESVNLALFSWLQISERVCQIPYIAAKRATQE
jgi:hypothetical protein